MRGVVGRGGEGGGGGGLGLRSEGRPYGGRARLSSREQWTVSEAVQGKVYVRLLGVGGAAGQS